MFFMINLFDGRVSISGAVFKPNIAWILVHFDNIQFNYAPRKLNEDTDESNFR